MYQGYNVHKTHQKAAWNIWQGICRSPEDAVRVLEDGVDVSLVEEQSAVGQSIQRAELAIIRTGPFADIVS